MNDNPLLAVATRVVSMASSPCFAQSGLVADLSTIHEHLSLAVGILPRRALDILKRLTNVVASPYAPGLPEPMSWRSTSRWVRRTDNQLNVPIMWTPLN